MIIAMYDLNNAYKRFQHIVDMLERVKKGNKITVDETTMFGNINSAIADIYNALDMLKCYRGNLASLRMVSSMFPLVVKQYQTMRENSNRDITEYIDTLNQLMDLLSGLTQDRNAMDIAPCELSGYSLSQWGYGDFVPPESVIDNILAHVDRKTEFNVVDINCDMAQTLLHIKEKMPRAELYGITKHNAVNMEREDRAKLNRFIVGGLSEAKVSNDTFNMAVIVPRVSLLRYQDEKNFTPEERKYLDRGFSYLRKGGLLVYFTPKCLISRSMASYLAKNLGEVHIIQDEEKMPGIVAIMGVKRNPWDRVLDTDTYTRLRSMIRNPEATRENYDPFSYSLPVGMVEVQKFRGTRLDDGEMNMLFEESNAMRDFWRKQKVMKISDHSAHPLLPFNVGQLGLVLTSGCLDGVIEEPNGCSHVVKGRVVKVTDATREFNDDGTQVQVSSTTSNRVEISMFLPDGTYKCLA